MIRKIIIKAVKVSRALYRHLVYLPYIKKEIGSIGADVYFPANFSISNPENLLCGNDVSFGENFMLLCSMAKCIIRDHVVFGPNVTVITGNHRTDIVGKYISDITEDDKWIMVNGQRENPYDKDVIFEGDNWIGANVTILKGVRIGFGAIVAAGAVVTKDCEPYCVYGGIPAGCISKRFNEEQIQQHEKLLGITDAKQF